ncbi:MAG: hypothetical protein NVS2B8_18040 [Vulcanimicrobiaceae bacterium]
MYRSFALALVAALGWSTVAAGAQIDPDDSGVGTKLGMAQQQNSGQVGTVTLFSRGANTLVVVNLTGESLGRIEPAHVHRGRDCDSLDPKPAFALAPVTNGISRTLVKAPESRLLSGNYVVNVHSSARTTRYVSCGELYHS